MEATGIHYLDVALIAAEFDAEVMVVIPGAAHDFARAPQRRNKTDALDATMLLEYLKRMPFVAWIAPRCALLELRHYGRHLTQLTADATVSRHRRHALSSTQARPKALRDDPRCSIAGFEKSIKRLCQKALQLIRADAGLLGGFDGLISMVGVAEISAAALLKGSRRCKAISAAERARAGPGLDVRAYESGSSVHRAPRISRHGNKYIRHALCHPALVAGQHAPHVCAFRKRLLDNGEKKMRATVATMGERLTAAWALIRTPRIHDGSNFHHGQAD